MTRLFDISDAFHPKVIYEKKIGAQVNMVSQSWDGQRVYFTSSLVSNWDKTEGPQGDLQYLKAFNWDGKTLKPAFALNFITAKLGRPHMMTFGAYSVGAQARTELPAPEVATLNH